MDQFKLSSLYSSVLDLIVNTNLTAVWFMLIQSDVEYLDVDEPNKLGLTSVILEFGAARIQIITGWDEILDPDLKFRIRVNANDDVESSDTLSSVDVSNSKLFRDVIGGPLSEVKIGFVNHTPQCLQFRFGSTPIAFSCGYGDDEAPFIGDGNDVLVLAPSEAMQNGLRWN